MIFNEYGVLVDKDLQYVEDTIHDNLTAGIKANLEGMTICDIMIFERHISLMIHNVFSSIILKEATLKRLK